MGEGHAAGCEADAAEDAYGVPVPGDGAPAVTPAEADHRAESWLYHALNARAARPFRLSPEAENPASWGPQAAPAYVDEATAVQIEADVERAFTPSSVATAPAFMASLRRLLRRFAACHPVLGYAQSMADVAAVALLGLTGGRCEYDVEVERAAYVLMCEIADSLPHDYYSNTLAGAQVECLVLEAMCRRHTPGVYNFLESADARASAAVTTIRWLLCLFAQDLPVRALFGLWDTLLAGDGKITLPPAQFVDRLLGACLAVLEVLPKEQFASGERSKTLVALNALKCAPAVAGRDAEAFLARAAQLSIMLKEDHEAEEAARVAARAQIEEYLRVVRSSWQLAELERRTLFTHAELKAMLDEFKQLGGHVTQQQFRRVLARSAPEWPGSLADAFFAWMDTVGRGELGFSELTLVLSVLCRGSLCERLGALFRALDAERRGRVTLDDVVRVLERKSAVGSFLEVPLLGVTRNHVDSVFKKYGDALTEQEFERVAVAEPTFIGLFLNETGDPCPDPIAPLRTGSTKVSLGSKALIPLPQIAACPMQ